MSTIETIFFDKNNKYVDENFLTSITDMKKSYWKNFRYMNQ